MAHANGRIYIDTSTTPHGGVSIADLQSVLSLVSYNDLGGIIDHASINKFAKFKPVRYPSVIATRGTVPTLYRDIDGKCGIEIPLLTATDFSDPDIEALITGANDYSLLKPRGKNINSEWFRLLDFDGYDHGASMGFQFVPPVVSQAGFININGSHKFTLRVGNLYTMSGTLSADVLSLVDLMMRFADSNGDLYMYEGSPQSWSKNNAITGNNSYGCLGIILVYTAFDDSVQVCLCSHGLSTLASDNNELSIDFSKIYEESGAPQPVVGDTVFLAPCFTNLDSEGEWVSLISGTSYPLIKCGLFPKAPSGSSSVDHVSYTLYTPVVVLAVLSYSVYGATLRSGYTASYKVSSPSASYVGVTVTAGTGVLGTNNTYKITNVNSSYSGAVSNTLVGNLSFNSTTRQASFQINLEDGNGHSIFMNDNIPIQIQILSEDGEYQNDTISIFSYNYNG